MGGYKNLLVYRCAVTIYDLTVIFCDHYIDKKSRTHDQMVQAARSGKQNIVEGSLENSTESNLKLTGVARASYGELAEDYGDFLRQHNLPIWEKDDQKVVKIRTFREDIKNLTNLTNLSNWTNLDFEKPENLANLLICLCYKETFLLDQLLRAQEKMFVEKGGFRENLFKKRRDFMKSNLTDWIN